MSYTGKVSGEQTEIAPELRFQGLGLGMWLAGSQLFSRKLLLVVREPFPAVNDPSQGILCFAAHSP